MVMSALDLGRQLFILEVVLSAVTLKESGGGLMISGRGNEQKSKLPFRMPLCRRSRIHECLIQRKFYLDLLAEGG